MAATLSVRLLDGGAHVISLTGTLDAPGTMDVEPQFHSVLREKGGKIVVDLSGLDYVSSYGLRMLLLGARGLLEAGGEMHLAGPNARVMELITLAGYDTIFPVHATMQEAADAVKQ